MILNVATMQVNVKIAWGWFLGEKLQ